MSEKNMRPVPRDLRAYSVIPEPKYKKDYPGQLVRLPRRRRVLLR